MESSVLSPAVPCRPGKSDSDNPGKVALSGTDALLKWVKFEDTSTLGGLHRIVEIDLIEGADEPDPERYASGERTEDVAKERDSLCWVQLGRGDLFFLAAHDDGRTAGSAQIAHPLDVAPGGQDPAPARDLDDGHGGGAR